MREYFLRHCYGPGNPWPEPAPERPPDGGHFDEFLCVNSTMFDMAELLVELRKTPDGPVLPLSWNGEKPAPGESILVPPEKPDLNPTVLTLHLVAPGAPGIAMLDGFVIPDADKYYIHRMTVGIAGAAEKTVSWHPFCVLELWRTQIELNLLDRYGKERTLPGAESRILVVNPAAFQLGG